MKIKIAVFRRIFYYTLVICLVLLAAWLRFWQLASIPPGLWFDEAYYAMDAVWLGKSNNWPVFLLGNNGREAMFSYLLALAIAIFGESIYVLRLVVAIIGVLSIAIMYRLVLTLFSGESRSYWLALISTGGLATSFWAVVMNRSVYRANLFPLFFLIVSYFFWRAWQTGKIRFYLSAGIALGLCQYTYLSARLFPLVFILFMSVQTLLLEKDKSKQLRIGWIGLFLMGGTSFLVAAPLLLFFLNNPQAFWNRVGDVAFKMSWSSEGIRALGFHVLEAFRVFVDGQDPNWRHHLLGRPVFDWFNSLGFWVGLVIAFSHYRRPVYLFLLSALFIMWLPALLSKPAFHTLRLSGILPAYYALMAVGLINLANWLVSPVSPLRRFIALPQQMYWVMLLALLLLSGGMTFFDYFCHWAKLDEVYQAYDGSVVDLAHNLTKPTTGTNLIIPFYLYTHASMRFLLHHTFQEQVLLPTEMIAELHRRRQTSIIIPKYPPDDHLPLAFVWLIREGTKPGLAYVSAVNREVNLNKLQSEVIDFVKDSRGKVIANRYEVETDEILPLFPSELPQKRIAVEWADNLVLTGYEFVPTLIKAGEANSLYLSWKILGYTGLQEKMFIQLLDSRSNPIGQQEIMPISRKMYRWRNDSLVLEQHLLEFNANLPAGLYFARLGFFEPKTGQRLLAYTPIKQPLGDELIVGPLYISANGLNPISPQYPVQFMFERNFELLGYSIHSLGIEQGVEIELYWKTHAPVDSNYTVFVQLLDEYNQIIAQVDAQPLPNLYPTSRWQRGDIISERFVLPVSMYKLSGSSKLVTGMYDLSTGARLSVYSAQGNLLPNGLVYLID